MIIGLISDTHSYLDPKVAGYFSGCDEIWHAGDIGSVDVLDSLNNIKPTLAVYGNIDGQEIRNSCPEDLWLERKGIHFLMTHIAGKPGKYNLRVRSLLQEKAPNVLICGHSHLLKVMKDPGYDDLLFINPGAAGRQGLHHMKTIMRLYLQEGKIFNLEVIELGKRGSIG